MVKKISIKKVFVSNPKYSGHRPDYYIVTNHKGKKLRVGSYRRAMEVYNASKRLKAKRNKK